MDSYYTDKPESSEASDKNGVRKNRNGEASERTVHVYPNLEPGKENESLSSLETRMNKSMGEGFSIDDIKYLAKKEFWDFFNGNEINNQQIAHYITDWGAKAGRLKIAKRVQLILRIEQDGYFGPDTIHAINRAHQKILFEAMKEDKKKHTRMMVRMLDTYKESIKRKHLNYLQLAWRRKIGLVAALTGAGLLIATTAYLFGKKNAS